jgi:hypothetical protein
MDHEGQQGFVDAYTESLKKREATDLHAFQVMGDIRDICSKNGESFCEEEIWK